MPHASHDSGLRARATADHSQLMDLRLLSQMAEGATTGASASGLAMPRFAATDLTHIPLTVARRPPPPPPAPVRRVHLAATEEPRAPLYALLAALTVAVAALATYVIFRPAPIIVVAAAEAPAAPSVLAAAARAPEDRDLAAAPHDDDDDDDDANDDDDDDDDANDANADDATPPPPATDGAVTRRPTPRRGHATSPATRPSPATKPAAKPDGPSLECQLGIGECSATTSRPRPARPDDDAGSKDPERPAKLTTGQVRTGLSGPKATAKRCAATHGATPGERVEVKLSISGATGKVTASTPQGAHAKTALGRCVANALSGATFPKFGDPAMGMMLGVRM